MCRRFWNHVLELGLTIWVLRAPVVSMLFGFLILGLAPQAQDLLVDVAAGPLWYIAAFLFVTFFVWAATAHYAARLLVNTDARYLDVIKQPDAWFMIWLQRWFPRILGSLAFVAMAMATFRSWLNVPTVQAEGITSGAVRSLIVLGFLLVFAFGIFWWYTAARSSLWRSKLVIEAEKYAGIVLRPLAARLPDALALGRTPGAKRIDSNLGPVVLIVLFICFTILPFIWPFVFAEWFPRALAVPFVLAGWTPLAVYASGVGRHLRVPIIALAFLIVWTLSYFIGDSYAVRTFPAPLSTAELAKKSKPGDQKKAADDASAPANARDKGLGLKVAIDLWKRVNKCEDNSSDCPRPILVAASGGASRAGFFTASVIGKLLDTKAKLPGSEETSPEGVRNRIFAISSVSGSSVGAVMTVAALAASDGRQPCHAKPHSLWHGKKVEGWRDCLEVLTSGDFLTPVFAGLVFRDTLRLLGRLGWSDRATLIEQSWEDVFAASVKATDGAPKLLTCIGSLDCPFLALRPTDEGDGKSGKVNWLPLLLLNGASVSTGQRIVTTLLDPWFEVARDLECPLNVLKRENENKSNNCPILDHTFDFHWLIGNGADGKGAKQDLRLSTAAHNSARFPIISPPGEVRDLDNDIVDRIVDGGYFENFGAQTAVELARAMTAIDANLAPFILIISNDPEIPLPDDVQAPDANEASFLTDLSGPVDAIMNARAARGTLAADGVDRALRTLLTPECAFYSAHIRVWPEEVEVRKSWLPWRKETVTRVRPLSFSWWSSIPVQLRLHQQTEFTDGSRNSYDNQQSFKRTLSALEKPPASCRAKGDIQPPAPRR